MEVLTLHYYLKVFSISLIIFIISISLNIFYLYNKKILLINNHFTIEKGEIIDELLVKNIQSINYFEIFFIKKNYQLINFLFNDFMHYGDFYVDKKKITIINFIKLIIQPSNILNKITIIEGWSQNELNNELSKYFENIYSIPYQDIIADTYYFEKNSDFKLFVKKLNIAREKFFKKYENNEISKLYNKKEIMTIGSLIEKEGLDNNDKKQISSVIFNRLNNNMKLQIDATVLYAITNGNYNLNRKLLLRDLTFDHPYNTYKTKGLPPGPISYVGKNTLKIIFENHKSDLLFYFFNKSLNRHIFSKNYEEHKKKLNEYRNN